MVLLELNEPLLVPDSSNATSNKRKSCFSSWCNPRWIFIFLGLLLMSVVTYYYALQNSSNKNNNVPPVCWTPETPSFQVSGVSGKLDIPEAGERAFFLETQGNTTLNTRQACTIESLALLNPDLPVYVLFTGGQFDNTTATLSTLLRYKNIRIMYTTLEDYVAGTPLEAWNRDSGWRQGPYRVAHLSDGLRLLTLAKYGGFYFDMDIIFVKPVTYYRNFIATEDGEKASNGAMHAERGYPPIQMAVEEFPKNYNRDAWSHNGPELITRMLKKWCGVEKLSEMDYVRCKGFSILSQPSFYPIFYPGWREYFDMRPANDPGKPNWLTDEVIGLHVWNKMSVDEPVFKNSTQYYTQFAKIRCPLVFSVAPAVF